jgi:hypothetical protein
MSVFKKVIMQSGQPEIAKVNRKTGVLYLSSDIWDRLPSDQKDFVLFHEEGHLRLQTADEFAANAYAVNKFTKAGTFSKQGLGQKIMVMREILSKAGPVSPFSVDDIKGAVQTLSVLGIGSKGRAREATANAQAQAVVYQAQAEAAEAKGKSVANALLVIGAFAVVITVIYLILRK